MKRLSPALLVAALALFLALGGAGYAGEALSTKSKVVSATVTVQPAHKGLVSARCPSGMHATGGGFVTDGVGANDSYPLLQQGAARGWTLTTHTLKIPKTGSAAPGKATVYAICSS